MEKRRARHGHASHETAEITDNRGNGGSSMEAKIKKEALELTKAFAEDKKACEFGARLILYSGIGCIRESSLQELCGILKVRRHIGSDKDNLTMEEYQRAAEFAKRLAALPEYAIVAFFAATSAYKELQGELERALPAP